MTTDGSLSLCDSRSLGFVLLFTREEERVRRGEGEGRGKAGVSGDCQQPPAPQRLTGVRPSWQARESLAEPGWDEHRSSDHPTHTTVTVILH